MKNLSLDMGTHRIDPTQTVDNTALYLSKIFFRKS